MKTEFLKGLGLEQDAIDKIMAENAKGSRGLHRANTMLPLHGRSR